MGLRRTQMFPVVAVLLSAALWAIRCGDDPAGPGPVSVPDAKVAADTAVVRAILNLNGLSAMRISEVSGPANHRVSYLNLSGLGIAHLPNSIAELDSLSELYLSNNRLSTLPDSIVQLTTLSVLTVRGNRLCDLSPAIEAWLTLNVTIAGWDTAQDCGSFTGDTLVVRGLLDTNGLREVASLSVADTSYERVTALFLAHRGLSVVTTAVGGLTQLRALDLHDNLLTSLPVSVTSLDSLEVVLLDDNRLCGLDTVVAAWADRVAGQWREFQSCSSSATGVRSRLFSDQAGDPVDSVQEGDAGWLRMETWDDSLVVDSIVAISDTALPPLALSFRPVGVPSYAASAVRCTIRTAGASYGQPGGSPLIRLGPQAAAYAVDLQLQPCLECSSVVTVPAIRIGDTLSVSLACRFRRVTADSAEVHRDTVVVTGLVDGAAFADLAPVSTGFMDFSTSTWGIERVDFAVRDSCKEEYTSVQDSAYDLYFAGDTLRAPRGIKRVGTVAWQQTYWYCSDLEEIRGVLDTLKVAVAQASYAPKAPFAPGGAYVVGRPDSTLAVFACIGLQSGGYNRMQFVWGRYRK